MCLNKWSVILKINGNSELIRYFGYFGIRENARICYCLQLPLKDPLLFLIDGNLVALRNHEASLIEVR